jgi:WD40 repeat protein
VWQFKHGDFVTSVAFHPINEKLFISSCLDEKLRLWNIPDKSVVHWLDTKSMLSASCFAPAATSFDGYVAMTGSIDGKWALFALRDKEGFRNLTRMDVRSRRGKNSKGHKVTGMSVHPEHDRVLITTNDSRVRLYNLNDYSIACKYKGHTCQKSQLRATFNRNGRYIIIGSEDGKVYIWNTVPPAGGRRDRNDSWECFAGSVSGAAAASLTGGRGTMTDEIGSAASLETPSVSAPVTAEQIAASSSGPLVPLTNAVFIPFRSDDPVGSVIVTTDIKGDIYVFENYASCAI